MNAVLPSAGSRDTAAPATSGASLLAFVAGFVDTAGFVALFGLFTAHMTGNLVLIGDSLATHRAGIAAKLLAFPVFLLVVAATRLYELRARRLGRDAAVPILLAEMAVLAAFLVAGVLAAPFTDAAAAGTILVGLLGVAAMSIQNASSRSVFAGHGPTTVMTGNVTQVTMDVVDLARGFDAAQARARLRRMGPPLLAFTAGAIAGGLGVMRFGFACLACPLVALAIVVAGYRRGSR
ncbi:YoaK family protein [Dokdonella ginsengisoli]|uniref:YoaK family protein n=1 Tax=Dokdonella ginsengisoli TaxID=363846 RepID=A0ABV9QV54_9GAMM